jgi:hypothetical protein
MLQELLQLILADFLLEAVGGMFRRCQTRRGVMKQRAAWLIACAGVVLGLLAWLGPPLIPWTAAVVGLLIAIPCALALGFWASVDELRGSTTKPSDDAV